MYRAHCPLCGEPLDETGACTACDYGEPIPEDALLFDDADLSILHESTEED